MLNARKIALGALLLLVCPVSPEAAETHIVEIVSDYDNLRMSFRPKTIVVQPGDTVTWVNLAAEDHNVISYPDGYPAGAKPLASPYLTKKGEKWSHTFHTKGTYEYHCIPHLPMGMYGAVIVSRRSSMTEFHKPSVSEMKKYTGRLREFFDDDEFKYNTRKERIRSKTNSKHIENHKK